MALAVVVTLTVDSSPEPRFREDLLVERASLAQFHLSFKNINFLHKLLIGLIFEKLLPGCQPSFLSFYLEAA